MYSVDMPRFIRRYFHLSKARPVLGSATTGSDLPIVEKLEHLCAPGNGPGHIFSESTELKPQSRPLLRLLFLIAVIACSLWPGQPLLRYASTAYHNIFHSAMSHIDAVFRLETGLEGSGFMPAAPPWDKDPVHAKPLSRTNWSLKCSSNEQDRGKMTDGEDATTWKSGENTSGGHWVEIDLKESQPIHSVEVQPARDWEKNGGAVRQHRIEVANRKGEWETVAFGAWWNTDGPKYATFEPRMAQYVRLLVINSALERKFVEISEINIHVGQITQVFPAESGRWNLTLDFPLVPVTAFVDPVSGKIITQASFLPNHFVGTNRQETYEATWDPKANSILNQTIGKGHDMFCPGTSFDERGRVLVTGGNQPSAFSIYDPNGQDKWLRGPDVKVERGYQGQTFLPDGRTFLIGGSWSGADGPDGSRDGEIYDPSRNKWELLPKITANFIRMAPVDLCLPDNPNEWRCRMTEWQQHHPWLYAWREGTVFHAGPSKEMNWFFTKPVDGDVKPAGLRADDDDAVCAIAAMYDAEKGEILTAGGARNYHYWFNADDPSNRRHRNESTTSAFKITLDSKLPGSSVDVKRVASMNYQRIFANSAIFPNGDVFVVGGQSKGEPFYDENWQPIPEIYSPTKDQWREAARHSTPRVYHSWALLLPDATVLVGGGGLRQDRRATNHYDAQIYQPAYLFNQDGSLADRPKISPLATKSYKVGERIEFTTSVAVNGASLIRYSAATHALNNDLRRINLTLVQEGDASLKSYSVTIPKDPGVALPGYWMLFVLQDDTPSISETVQVLA